MRAHCRTESFGSGYPITLHVCFASTFVAAVAIPDSVAAGAIMTTRIMEILCVGEDYELIRPCVDCGRWTGRYSDHCLGADRIPGQYWNRDQHTPLCSRCDWTMQRCHSRDCNGAAQRLGAQMTVPDTDPTASRSEGSTGRFGPGRQRLPAV